MGAMRDAHVADSWRAAGARLCAESTEVAEVTAR